MMGGNGTDIRRPSNLQRSSMSTLTASPDNVMGRANGDFLSLRPPGTHGARQRCSVAANGDACWDERQIRHASASVVS